MKNCHSIFSHKKNCQPEVWGDDSSYDPKLIFLFGVLGVCNGSFHCSVTFISDEETVRGRDVKFRTQILTGGATKDKIAAHILRLTEAPLHSLHHLDKLISFISANKDSHLREIASKLTSPYALTGHRLG